MKTMPISFFAQIIKLIPRGAFDKIVIEEKADKYSKRLLSWDQLIAMLWCQFSGAESLRDIARGLYSGVGKLQHIQAQPMSRSSLAYANANRTYRIFERLYYELKDLLFKGDLGRLAKVRILICVNGVLKHVNTPDSYLRERCANIVDSVRSLA